LIPEKDYSLWYDIVNWDKFKFIKDWEDSETAVKSTKPMICIASSGFCSGGRIRSYIQYNLGSENNTFLFVGFSTEDSLAGIIKDGKKKEIEVDGIKVKNKAKVVNLTSFSSHIQHKQMLELYSSFTCKELYLVHGEKSRQYEFAQLLTDKYSELSKTTKVFVPNMNDTIEV
jgi:metallo-beta-lactamase family protein